MKENTCPSAAELSAFVLGTLPESALEVIAGHLDQCHACEAAVAALDHMSDPVVAGLRRTPASGELSRAAAASRLLAAGQSHAAPEQLGDYHILRELGRGGMGIVYEAEQVSLRRRVALKVLPRHALLDPETVERFRREARAAARLHHTNIVPVFGSGEQNDLHYIVMQFIPGSGLDRVIRELRRRQQPTLPAWEDESGSRTDRAGRPSPLAASVRGLLTGQFPVGADGDSDPVASRTDPAGVSPVVTGARAAPAPAVPQTVGGDVSDSSGRAYWLSVARLGIQVADALAFAHSQGVVHRDIKPSNLLLDPHGRLWIADFGLAKEMAGPQDLTRTGFLVGTLRYAPPERFAGVSDALGDVYGLGLTLYELLTLRPAFPEVDRSKLLHLVMNTEPPRPRKLNPAVPRDLETVVLKASARDSRHRYANAAEFADDLRRFVADQPIRARRVTLVERLARACRRDPVRASLVAALILACVVGVAGVAAQWWRAETKARAETLARAGAELAEEGARGNLYFSQVAQARLLWRFHDLAGAEDLLDRCEPARRGWEWRHLRAVNRAELLRIPTPDLSFVLQMDFHPNGRFLALAGWSPFHQKGEPSPNTIQIWDLRSGCRRLALPGKSDEAALAATFSPDGEFFVISYYQVETGVVTVELRKTATGERVHSWKGGPAAFSPDGRLVAAGGEKEVVFWATATSKEVRRFPSPGGRVIFSPDGKHFAVSGPQAVELRDLVTGKIVQRLPHGPGEWVTGTQRYFASLGPNLAFSPDGRQVVTATNPPRIWEALSGRLLHTLAGHDGLVPGVAFAPDGRSVATAGDDGTVRLWDVQNGSTRGIWRGHQGGARCVCFHPDGWRLASGGRQPGDVKVWDLTRDPEHFTLQDVNPLAITFAAGSGSSASLNVIDILGHLRVHDVETGRMLTRTCIDLTRDWLTPARVAVFSSDGRTMAAVSSDRRVVKLHDAASGREIQVLPAMDALARHVSLSHNGGRVAAVGLSRNKDRSFREVRVWDAADREPLALFRPAVAPTPYTHGVAALSPDGDRVAYDDYEGGQARVRIAEVAGGREVLSLSLGGEMVYWITFSADGRLLAAVNDNEEIAVWDAATGKPLHDRRLRGPQYRLEFSPDGRRLAAVDRDQVKVWDVQTGQEILTLRGAPPRSVDGGFNPMLAWSPDGRRLAASTWRGDVSVWDAAAPGEDGPAPPGVVAERAYHWHLQEGRLAMLSGQARAAVFHLERALRQEPPDVRSRQRQAYLLQRRGALKQAAADYARAFAEYESENDAIWLGYARSLLGSGSVEDYRRLSARMVSRSARGRVPAGETYLVRACVLGPGGSADAASLLRLARTTQAKSPTNPQDLFSLGLAHYRAGQWQDAQRRLEETQAADPASAYLVWPVLAMIHHRLGERVEARRWLDRAADWHKMAAGRLAEPTGGFSLPEEWVDFAILYGEARALVMGSKS